MKNHEPDQSFAFLSPWVAVAGAFAKNLEKELLKEVTRDHPLHSLEARAIAQRSDTDDVLFEVDAPNFRYAVVHLSWAEDPEGDPRWPNTEVFATFEGWIEGRMRPDSQQFSDP